LAVRAAADVVRQLALAVQHAHDHRVLHRDLKPGNVLLTTTGAPKVADFGLAKLLDVDDDLTQMGAVLGTPAYMAPEQAEGLLNDVRERTDVWSLGAILYEALTGRQAFKGKSRSETLELVKRQPPLPPCSLRAEVPTGLEAICLKCLEKQPGHRYATAAELAADLQDWLDGKPIRTRPLRGGRRNGLVATFSVVCLLALTIGGFSLLSGDRPTQTGPAPLTPQEPSAGVWNPLLLQEPTAIRWPHPGTNSHKGYRSGSQELVLSCEELGLLGLGRTDAPRYKLALTVQQSPWAGNIGLFFGYRDCLVGGDPGQTYQVLELVVEPTKPEQGPNFRIDWRTVFQVDRGGAERLTNVARGNSSSFALDPKEHRLELTVGVKGLEQVSLDNTALAGLSATRATHPPEPVDYQGQFGVYVYTGNGLFRNASFIFWEEP
jgi:hypothetical protein